MRRFSMLQNIVLSMGLLSLNIFLLQQNAHQAKVIDVTLCNLIREPSKYDGRYVRVSAIYYVLHHEALYDPKCNIRNYVIRPRFDCDSEDKCKKLIDLVDRNASTFIILQRTNIIAVGKFKKVGVLDQGYSMGPALQFEFAIKQIERATPTLPNTPGPQ